MQLSHTIRHFWQFVTGYCVAGLLVSVIHAVLFGWAIGLVALGVVLLIFTVVITIGQPLFVPYRVKQWRVEPVSLLDWTDYDWSEVDRLTDEMADLGFVPLQDYSQAHKTQDYQLIARCFGNENLGSFAEIGFCLTPIAPATKADTTVTPTEAILTEAISDTALLDPSMSTPISINDRDTQAVPDSDAQPPATAEPTETAQLTLPILETSPTEATPAITTEGLSEPTVAANASAMVLATDRPQPQITHTVFFSIFDQGWMLIDGNFSPHRRESLIYAWRNPREVRHYYPNLSATSLCNEHIGHRQSMIRRLDLKIEQNITWEAYRDIQQELITQPWLRLRRRNLLAAMLDATRFEQKPAYEWLGEYGKVLNREISKF